MPISVKTRKSLWARSGNRCALCQKELIAPQADGIAHLNIGEECHIISSQENGPRFKPDYSDYDRYDNLILLCCNHHKSIDELTSIYTVEILLSIKKYHEIWVASVLSKASNKAKSDLPKIKLLPRITSGKQLVDLTNGAHGWLMDHDELNTEEEVDFIGYFLQNLKDWADCFDVVEKSEQVRLGFEWNKDLQTLDELGFFVFGDRKCVRMMNNENKDTGLWELVTLVVFRREKSFQFKNEFVPIQEPAHLSITF